MNVSSTTIPTVKSSKNTTSTTTSGTSSTTSFEEELSSVKTQEATVTKTETASESDKSAKTVQNSENTQVKTAEEVAEAANAEKVEENNLSKTTEEQLKQAAEKNLAKNFSQNVEKNIVVKKNEAKKAAAKETESIDPIEELTSKIAKLNELKNNLNPIQGATAKTDDKSDSCPTVKMDNNDVTFFVNLVQNQTTATQGISINNLSTATTAETVNKTESTQSAVQVSATLMDALNTSMTTNKPFRIDFGNDIAVIMKVDKDGVLSANFIPGSGAVEAYLKQNLPLLKQSFNDQNLSYNELTYSNQQKQKQKQENDKENKNE